MAICCRSALHALRRGAGRGALRMGVPRPVLHAPLLQDPRAGRGALRRGRDVRFPLIPPAGVGTPPTPGRCKDVSGEAAPGLYRYELTVGIKENGIFSGNSHIFKGQFFVE